MKHLCLFETFIKPDERHPSNQPGSKETPRNTHLIYTDNNLSIKVVKTLDSSKAVSDPQWCSTQSDGFYKHNLTSNLYRFIFKDGYKLRLTWDYIDWDGVDFSNGTHWGQGGILNGKPALYAYIRPRDENNPFYFDYNKNDDRQYMINRIKSIPKEAIDVIYKYQELHKKEKMALFNNLYKEIEKIKIIGLEEYEEEFLKKFKFYHINAMYNGKIYKFKANLDSGFNLWSFSEEFRKDFKNKYALSEREALNKYILDKSMEWLKLNNKDLYLQFKNSKSKESGSF